MLHVQVVAIGAQQIDRAKTFGERHGISTVYGSYEELAQNGDIGMWAAVDNDSLWKQNIKILMDAKIRMTTRLLKYM